jgi:integrase
MPAMRGTPAHPVHRRRFDSGRAARDRAGRAGRTNPEALMFTAPGGGVLCNHNFRRRVFMPAAETVGVPGLTQHDLRHTADSLAVQAGANVKAVQRMLGHASAAMTLDVYAWLFGDDLDAVADRLDEAAVRARADSLRTRARLRTIRSVDARDENAV